MTNCWFYSPVILLSLCTHAEAFDQGQLKAVTSSARVAGVFLILVDGNYNFTAAEAGDACRGLNATVVTEQQMGVALQRGMQTCKYGWMEGPKAVIPRQTPDSKCGNGRVGLAFWNADVNKLFGAFCFKAEDVQTTEAIPVPSKPVTTATSPSSSASSVTTANTSSSTSSRSTSVSPAAPRLTSRGKLNSTPATTMLAHSLSSLPLHPYSATTTTTASASSSTSNTTKVSSNRSYTEVRLIGALRVALIVVGLTVAVLAVAVAYWYCKPPRRFLPPPWSRPQQPREKVETEMWRQCDADSDADHSTQLAAENKTDVTLLNQSETNTNAALVERSLLTAVSVQ